MNVIGNEIAVRKRHLEEIFPQVPAAAVNVKTAGHQDENAGNKTAAVRTSQTLTPFETQHILKRFEPLAPVLQKALEGTQNLRREVQNLEVLTRPSIEPLGKPVVAQLTQPQAPVETTASRVGDRQPPIPPVAHFENSPTKTGSPILSPINPPLRTLGMENPALTGAEAVARPTHPIQEPRLSQGVALEKSVSKIGTLPMPVDSSRFLAERPHVPERTVAPINPPLRKEINPVQVATTPFRANPPVPTVPREKTPSMVMANLEIHGATTHRTEEAKTPTVIGPTNQAGQGNNLPKIQPPEEVIGSRPPEKPQTVPATHAVQETPRPVVHGEQPHLSSNELGNTRPLSAPRTSSLPIRVEATREPSRTTPLVLRPAISPISGTTASATLTRGAQTAEPMVIPAAGGELSPAAIRERAFVAFQRRIRQQEPQAFIAEARHALQGQPVRPSNAVLPLEQTTLEPRNDRILGPSVTRPETVARTPFHGDNGTQIARTGRETTVPTTENVNRPRLTPLGGINLAPPLSNINQLRRPLPTNVRSRLVGLNAVNILDLVL